MHRTSGLLFNVPCFIKVQRSSLFLGFMTLPPSFFSVVRRSTNMQRFWHCCPTLSSGNKTQSRRRESHWPRKELYVRSIFIGGGKKAGQPLIFRLLLQIWTISVAGGRRKKEETTDSMSLYYRTPHGYYVPSIQTSMVNHPRIEQKEL